MSGYHFDFDFDFGSRDFRVMMLTSLLLFFDFVDLVIDETLLDEAKVREDDENVTERRGGGCVQYFYTFQSTQRGLCVSKGNGRDSRDISTDKIHVYIMLYDMQLPRQDKTLISLYVPLPSPLLVH